jgi:hypothetical protein
VILSYVEYRDQLTFTLLRGPAKLEDLDGARLFVGVCLQITLIPPNQRGHNGQHICPERICLHVNPNGGLELFHRALAKPLLPILTNAGGDG